MKIEVKTIVLKMKHDSTFYPSQPVSSSLTASWHCWASLWMLIQWIKFTSELTRSQASPQWQWATFHLLLPVCCILCRCEGAFVKLHGRRNKDLPFIKITRLCPFSDSQPALLSIFSCPISHISAKITPLPCDIHIIVFLFIPAFLTAFCWTAGRLVQR